MNIDWANGVPLMVGPIQIGHAEPSPETAGYWDGIREEKLMIKRCGGCGRNHHPRRIICQYCDSDRFEWFEVAGNATVYSYSTVYRAPSEEFVKELPYTVGIVELAEGVHIFSRIKAPEGREPRVGEAATLTFQETGNWGRLPAFVVKD
jgi:uncharacterized OB-fold protein